MSAVENVCQEVLVALRKIIRAIDLHSRELVQHHGFTGPQLVLLRQLESLGGVPIGQLAHVVSLSHATVTGILDRLERRGVVQRHRSDSDRRQIVVRLTEQGHKALASAPPPLQESFLNNFRRLQDWEQTLVLSSLQRIASMMQVGEIEGGPVLVSGPITATVEQTASFLAHPEVCQEAHVEPGSPEGPDPTKK